MKKRKSTLERVVAALGSLAVLILGFYVLPSWYDKHRKD